MSAKAVTGIWKTSMTSLPLCNKERAASHRNTNGFYYIYIYIYIYIYTYISIKRMLIIYSNAPNTIRPQFPSPLDMSICRYVSNCELHFISFFLQESPSTISLMTVRGRRLPSGEELDPFDTCKRRQR